jgi:hypothetical protein
MQAQQTGLHGHVRLRRVRLPSLFRYGVGLGSACTCLPAAVCSLLTTQVMGVLRRWLDSWKQVVITVFGTEVVSVDLIDVLRLRSVMTRLEWLDHRSALVVGTLFVAFAVLGSCLATSWLLLSGSLYNLLARLTGGVEIEVEDTH